MQELTNLLARLRLDKTLFSRDEAAIKQAVILPVLKALGWDPFNVEEVAPEYTVGGQRVDYALRELKGGDAKVFVEAKRGTEELEKHEEQLLKYAFQAGVDLAVLTNGSAWWFYLPTQRGSWDQRKFYTIDVLDQDSTEVAQRFFEFLRKASVEDGSSVENAKRVMRGRQRQQQIAETLPKAWSRLVQEPDELLVDLVADTTEKLCGFKPESSQVRDYLRTTQSPAVPARVPGKARAARTKQVLSKRQPSTYSGHQIESFSFLGRTYAVPTFREMLTEVCNILYARHAADFAKVETLVGKKRVYFSTSSKNMWEPRRVKGTSYFVETHFSADMVVRFVHKVLALFGYDPNSLTVNLRQG